MRLDDEVESTHVEDRRSGGMGRIGGGGRMPSGKQMMFLWPVVRMLLKTKIGWAILIAGAAFYIFSGNSMSLLTGGSKHTVNSASEEKEAVFIKKVLANTEKVWGRLIPGYRPPVLVLYRGVTRSGCGYARAQTGPFYCPADQKVYLDLSFFNELARRHHASGDFAQAYVLAHEIGHHVQNMQGILSKVHALQQRAAAQGRKTLANHLQIPVELQADCYAGIWAHYARNRLEPGDIEEAMNAASRIGDDTLQKEAQGYVVPDSFTHGTSKERMSWFLRGYKSGKIKDCNTFR